MRELKHMVAGFLIAGIMIGLFAASYESLEDGYGVVRDDVKVIDGETGSIMDHLSNLNLINATNQVSLAVKGLGFNLGLTIQIPKLLFAIGEAILGVVTFPFEIMNIIGAFYQIPKIIVIGVESILVFYVAFLTFKLFRRN